MDFDNRLLTLANQMADAAGEIARRYFGSDITVEQKSDLSPVTVADREIEAAMCALITAQFPDHGIIGEEDGAVRPASEYQWVLDPIDGTRAFIAGYPTFTTLIALCKNNAPILGVIDQPILKQRWVGVSGKVSHKIGNKILADALIATTSTYYFTKPQAEKFEALRRQCKNIILGGDAYAYAMLADGRIDVVVDAGMKPYDFCALVPVVEGAGGIITDWDGRPVTLASDGNILAASNRELHNQALKILRPASA